jgi:hypothetical protein
MKRISPIPILLVSRLARASPLETKAKQYPRHPLHPPDPRRAVQFREHKGRWTIQGQRLAARLEKLSQEPGALLGAQPTEHLRLVVELRVPNEVAE